MKFLEAVLILSGMIIGVGMFGIPFSFAKAGFGLGAVELVVLAGIMIILHLIYGEIILSTPVRHRFPGYVGMYLGAKAEYLAALAAFFGTGGALLAYLIIGASFLQNIASYFWQDSYEFFWVVAMVASGAIIMRFSLRKEALINGILTALLIGFLLYIIALLMPRVSYEELAGFNLSEIFLPYGVLLFALSGGIAIPDLVNLLGKNRAKSRLAIITGTLIPAVLYFLFAFAVVGVNGGATSSEAIRGLKIEIGSVLTVLGSVAGFLAVYTSFIILNANTKALLELDFKVRDGIAWLATILVPFGFYLAGFQNFIVIIGAVGATAGGIDAALLIAAYHKTQTASRLSWFSYVWKFLIFLMVALGIGYEVIKFFE